MQSDLRSALVFMCRRILHPLTRMLIRFGVSAGELKAIVDSVYAHAAAEHLASQGERVSYSKLAVITGINRSFLPAILATPQDEFRPRSRTQLHRAARVLNGWHDDVHFQTRAGEPAVLPLTGGRKSFEQLAHRYSGGVYYPTLLSELLRVGAVKMVGPDRVRALRRAPAPGGASVEAITHAGEIAGELLATLHRNLTAPAHEQLPVRALTHRVDSRSLSLFRAQLARRADALLEMTDAFLQRHRRGARRGSRPAHDSKDVILGAAVFAICKDAESEPPAPGKPGARRLPALRGRKPAAARRAPSDTTRKA